MMKETFIIMDVKGAEIKGTLDAEKRPDSAIKELQDIIQQKNAIIEQQTEYIAELQDDVHRLTNTVKMLTI